MTRIAAAVAAWAVAVGAFSVCAASVAFARKATEISPKRKDNLPIISWTDEIVEVAATRATLAPGRYSLYTGRGSGHARIGKIVTTTTETVVREVEAIYRPAPTGVTHGYWSGYAFETPADLDLPSFDVEIPVDRGSAPAWLIPGSSADVWTIHIHGLGGRRAACLRSAPVFHALGHTQLVVSYSGDRDAPPLKDGRHHFGLDEWRDVDAALRFAVANGARTVVLSAWSMGATIALQLLERSAFRHVLAGLVLTAPVLDWPVTLMEQGLAAGLPAFIPRIGLTILESGLLHRLAGLSHKLDFSSASWFEARPSEPPPILILHSPCDPMAPFALSERWAAENSADLKSVISPGHTLEWSSQLKACEDAVRKWFHLNVLPTSGRASKVETS